MKIPKVVYRKIIPSSAGWADVLLAFPIRALRSGVSDACAIELFTKASAIAPELSPETA
jgi:hypothetical protein